MRMLSQYYCHLLGQFFSLGWSKVWTPYRAPCSDDEAVRGGCVLARLLCLLLSDGEIPARRPNSNRSHVVDVGSIDPKNGIMGQNEAAEYSHHQQTKQTKPPIDVMLGPEESSTQHLALSDIVKILSSQLEVYRQTNFCKCFIGLFVFFNLHVS